MVQIGEAEAGCDALMCSMRKAESWEKDVIVVAQTDGSWRRRKKAGGPRQELERGGKNDRPNERKRKAIL